MPPWLWQSTLVDYDLQYDVGGKWVTLETINEPTKTFGFYTPTNQTTVDSYFSDRWIFIHQFAPVTTSKIRLWVRTTTSGGGATPKVREAGGQTGDPSVMIREIEVYGQ